MNNPTNELIEKVARKISAFLNNEASFLTWLECLDCALAALSVIPDCGELETIAEQMAEALQQVVNGRNTSKVDDALSVYNAWKLKLTTELKGE